jgi:hypothetical protein
MNFFTFSLFHFSACKSEQVKKFLHHLLMGLCINTSLKWKIDLQKNPACHVLNHSLDRDTNWVASFWFNASSNLRQ